ERVLLPALLRLEQRARDHAQLDVDDVVRQPAAVGEPRGVAGDRAEAARVASGRHAEVDLQRVGRNGLRADLRQPRDAGEQRLDDVRTVRFLDAEVEQRVQQAGGLRVQRVLAEVLQVV